MWKDIEKYEGLYWVNEEGQIKNSNNHIMKPYLTKRGYHRIGLYKDGKTVKYLVHRIVAQAFLPNPKQLPEVNHIDTNKKNNCVNNLEWTTGKENVQHAVANLEGRKEYLVEEMSSIGKKYNHLGVEASKKAVCQIDIHTGEVLGVFESAREASKETNSNYRNISQVCKGDRKTHNGYIWEFV